MNKKLTSIVVFSLIALIGCNPVPSNGEVAVVDLNAVAKATERDQAINATMESARVELNEQLTQIAGDLEQQLKTQQEKVGASPNAEDQQQLQEMAVQAQRQLAEKQQLAQQKANQFQVELVNEFKRQVTPVVERLARERGADVVVILDDSILWFESAVDITDEVIAELRANPLPPIQIRPSQDDMPDTQPSP